MMPRFKSSSKPTNAVPIVRVGFIVEYLGHSNVQDRFWLSYCRSYEHHVRVTAGMGHTVITNELAHGLNFWSLSRYLYNLIPSTSQVNLYG